MTKHPILQFATSTAVLHHIEERLGNGGSRKIAEAVYGHLDATGRIWFDAGFYAMYADTDFLAICEQLDLDWLTFEPSDLLDSEVEVA